MSPGMARVRRRPGGLAGPWLYRLVTLSFTLEVKLLVASSAVGVATAASKVLFFIPRPLGIISRRPRPFPLVLPRWHATQRARSEIFKLSLLSQWLRLAAAWQCLALGLSE